MEEVNYCLDFAIFCKTGQLDVECDGDTYHLQKEIAMKDNARNNYLTSQGWSVLRFGSKEINENISSCIDTVNKTADTYGGIIVPNSNRTLAFENLEQYSQMNLF
ncbi:MAG: DUF559 domain-containing protein [Candidatus Stahlbacteria bacterium]|nr:DUF559 domain-containing protein [Candidatus Stahlbacteria bacterium]